MGQRGSTVMPAPSLSAFASRSFVLFVSFVVLTLSAGRSMNVVPSSLAPFLWQHPPWTSIASFKYHCLHITDAQSAIERPETPLNNLGAPHFWLKTTKRLRHTRGIKSTVFPWACPWLWSKRETKSNSGRRIFKQSMTSSNWTTMCWKTIPISTLCCTNEETPDKWQFSQRLLCSRGHYLSCCNFVFVFCALSEGVNFYELLIRYIGIPRLESRDTNADIMSPSPRDLGKVLILDLVRSNFLLEK